MDKMEWTTKAKDINEWEEEDMSAWGDESGDLSPYGVTIKKTTPGTGKMRRPALAASVTRGLEKPEKETAAVRIILPIASRMDEELSSDSCPWDISTEGNTEGAPKTKVITHLDNEDLNECEDDNGGVSPFASIIQRVQPVTGKNRRPKTKDSVTESLPLSLGRRMDARVSESCTLVLNGQVSRTEFEIPVWNTSLYMTRLTYCCCI